LNGHKFEVDISWIYYIVVMEVKILKFGVT